MGQVLRERLPVVDLTWDGQTSCVACIRPMRLHHWKGKCNGLWQGTEIGLEKWFERKALLLRMKPEEELQNGRGEGVRWMPTVQVKYTPYCLGEQKRC
jgi:hypothetical protein